MKRFVLNQTGFTFLEAIISLMITSILALATASTLLKLYDYHHLNQAITVLQADLHYVRDFNMGPLQSDDLMRLRIYPERNQYELIIGSLGKTHTKRQLPKSINIHNGYQFVDLTFNTQGNVQQGQTLTISSKYYSKNLVFSIGSGGFDIRDSN